MSNQYYRSSSYSIVVPLDKEPENIFMIHGYSGAIDILQKEIAMFLKTHDQFEKEELPCSNETAERLEKRGYITKLTINEEIEYVRRLAFALYRKENILTCNFTVVVTYDCNFRCPYCYEKDIVRTTNSFSQEMTDSLFKTIQAIAPERKLRKNIITLYGGEPFMKENYENVKFLVRRGITEGFRFSAITNGYDLDRYEDLLGPDSICHIQVTIDGMPDLHNKKRIHKCGIPTFDKIIQNIALALEKKVRVTIRVNTDSQNIHQLKELQQIFTEKGYTNNAQFHMYSALLRNHADQNAPKNVMNQKEYIEQIKNLDVDCSFHDYGLSDKIATSIKRNKPISLGVSFCGAQNRGFVLDPLGNIYPCWEVVNQKEHLLGKYNQDGIQWNDAVNDRWRSSKIADRKCVECKYVFLCRGGCPAHQLDNHRCTHMEDIVHYAVNRTYKDAL